MRTFEIAPGHQTPDSLRGSAKPLSLRRAFTTPPKPPKREIKEAHHHGFISSALPLLSIGAIRDLFVTDDRMNFEKPHVATGKGGDSRDVSRFSLTHHSK